MKRLLTGIGLTSAVVLALALSACAPAVTPIHTNSPAPTAQASATPTPHQAASPSVRVPVTCANLFTAAVSSTLVGVSVQVREDQTTVPAGITSITARQYGTLHCLWGGQDTQDGGYVAQLQVDIAPDAAAGYAANISAIEGENPPTAQNTAGDKSEYNCQVQGDYGCSANMLLGSYWVTVYLGDLGVGTVSQSAANSHIQLALATIATALKTATPSPAWKPPGVLPGFCSAPDSLAKVQAAVGESDFAVTGQDSGPADAGSYAQLPGVYAQCGWGGTSSTEKFTSVQVALLRGGSWAIAGLNGVQDPEEYMLGAYATMSVPGADSAVSACSTGANECVVFLTIGTTLVFVELDDPGTPQVTSVLSALVTDIKAS